MKRYLKWFALALPLMTSACHFKFTSPMLEAAQTGAGLHLCLSLWMVNLVFIAAAVLAIREMK